MQRSLLLLSIFSAVQFAYAAKQQDKCAPEPPAACNPDDCKNCYCLGPENYGVNAPTGPKTCSGDLTFTVAGFYWNAHEDGMEYAIDNSITPPTVTSNLSTGVLNNLTDAQFITPNFDWNWGFKVGLGYCTTTDGWDVGILWTWYQGQASDEVEREPDDNAVLLPLFSAYAPLQGGVLYASNIETFWKLQLNLIDIEIGRSFWTSKYVNLRPFMGLRIAFIDQNFDIEHKGGSFSANSATSPVQQAFNNEVDLENDYKGVGIRAGMNSVWNVGCGWGLYGNLAFSILYGRFDTSFEETNRLASSPHDKVDIAEVEDHFRTSKATADLALGIQWQTMFNQCKYGFTFMLGWEQHLFWNQNQLWRINRIGDVFQTSGNANLFNNTGENVLSQRRGDLDTQGWTLTLKFDF